MDKFIYIYIVILMRVRVIDGEKYYRFSKREEELVDEAITGEAHFASDLLAYELGDKAGAKEWLRLYRDFHNLRYGHHRKEWKEMLEDIVELKEKHWFQLKTVMGGIWDNPEDYPDKFMLSILAGDWVPDWRYNYRKIREDLRRGMR